MQCPFCKEEVLDGATKCKHCGSTIGVLPVRMATVDQSDFGELFTTSINIWKANLVDLIILTLVFMLLVWIPIANIGFIAGYTRSLMKVARSQGRAEVGDLFNAWDCFANLLLYLILSLIAVVILHFVPIIGSLAALALGFAIAPGMYAIIDNKCGAIDAYKWSFETIQANFVNWLLAYLVANVIACAGMIALFIGIIVSAPLGALIYILQYERVKPI
ncbi:MAG: zinc ribbon domain-containing protein [Desulfuromonadales bacterium]|nr:zinc ribbon domain-containing protein [Desulfuromonadales bacterium]